MTDTYQFRLAWVIDPPTRTVAIYRGPGEPERVLDEAAQLEGDPVLSGFVLPVAELFRDVPTIL